MIAPWANDVVLVAIGLGVGFLVAVIGIVGQNLAPREPDEPGERHMGRLDDEIDRGVQELLAHRSVWLAGFSVEALILVLVLVVWLGPIDFEWQTFFLSAVAGVLLMLVVYRLALVGRLTLRGPSLLDPLADGARPQEPSRDTDG